VKGFKFIAISVCLQHTHAHTNQTYINITIIAGIINNTTQSVRHWQMTPLSTFDQYISLHTVYRHFTMRITHTPHSVLSLHNENYTLPTRENIYFYVLNRNKYIIKDIQHKVSQINILMRRKKINDFFQRW